MKTMFEEKLEDVEMIGLCERLKESLQQFKKAFKMENKIKLIFVNRKDLLPSYCEGNETIILNKEFMKLLTNHLFEDSELASSLIFKGLYGDKYRDTFIFIRGFILEFVILHELFHIYYKHNKEVKQSDSFCEKDNIEHDADLEAIKYTFAKYSTLIKKGGIVEYGYLIEKCFYAILYLFNLISLNNIVISNSHKLIYIRIIFLFSKMVDLKREKPDLFHLTIDEIEDIRDNCIYNFILKNRDFFNINLISIDGIDKSLSNFFKFRKERNR